MLETLLASGARPGGSRAGAAASVLVHGLLIGGALIGTARAVRPEHQKEKLEEHVAFVAPKPEPKPLPAEAPKAFVAPRKTVAPKVAVAKPQPPKVQAPRMVQLAPAPKVATAPAAPAPVAIPTNIPPVNVPLAPVATDLASKAATAAANELADKARAAEASAAKGRVVTESGGDVADRQTYEESEVDKEVVPIGGTPVPRYPEHLRASNKTGTVMVQFIVGTNGRVEGGSIKILSSADDAFSEAVKDALRSARYRPAEAGGHKVRQLVEQSFSFRLGS